MVKKQQAHDVIVTLLAQIAPEADLEALDPNADLREALDIDSYDYLNFIVGISDQLGIDVPESDYAKLDTLAGCENYLESKKSA